MRSPHVVVMLTLVAGCGVSADGRTGGPDASVEVDAAGNADATVSCQLPPL